MKYYNVEKLDNTGLVKTLFVPKGQARWRIYSYDIEADMADIKNYEEIGMSFGIKPDHMIRVMQKHTDNIQIVREGDEGMGVTCHEIEGYCDGMITNLKGVMLLTVEADCTPVYTLDPVNKAIGMVHSGWRGTVKKIAEKAINLMSDNYGTKKEDVLVHFGPAICKNCYEVGMELIDEFKKILECDEVHKVFKPIVDKKEKYLLDVTESIRLSLIRYGVKEENITRTNICTYHGDEFDSWRRDKDKTKQMLTGIVLV